MLKYIILIAGFLVSCLYAQAAEIMPAGENNIQLKTYEVTKLEGKFRGITYRSMTINDVPTIIELTKQCKAEMKEFGATLKEEPKPGILRVEDETWGLPDNLETWSKNLLIRQLESGNPYSGLLLSYKDKPVGFLTLGVMSALGFNNGYNLAEHSEIVKTFEKMGTIELKVEHAKVKEPKFTKEIYESIEDCGMCDFLPVLPSVAKEIIQDALRIGVMAAQLLKDKKLKLPRGENTIPKYVI